MLLLFSRGDNSVKENCIRGANLVQEENYIKGANSFKENYIKKDNSVIKRRKLYQGS